MLGKGFRYGMFVQLAIGPVSLLVFRTSGSAGFGMGLILVLAVALVDAFFIAIAGAGSVLFLKNENIQGAFIIFSSVVLALFGLYTVLGAFNISMFPGIKLFSGVNSGSVFLQGVLLTASNPMTILFWNSILTAQTKRETMNSRHIFYFGTGCVLSTVVFLTIVAAIGSMVNRFLPDSVIRILNVLIGLSLIVYSAVLLMQKRRSRQLADCPK